jgi:hypothetical protein
MRLFKRDTRIEARTAPVLVQPRRRPAATCFGCGRARRPYVYLENGHDYCLTCAQLILVELGIRPAGRRQGDAAAGELVLEQAADESRRPRPYIA